MCSHALANSVTARNSAIPEQAVATDNSYYYQQYPQQYYGYNWNNLLNQKQGKLQTLYCMMGFNPVAPMT